MSNKQLEWVKISILPTLEQVVCQATNRIFVGKPLCASLLSSYLSGTY